MNVARFFFNKFKVIFYAVLILVCLFLSFYFNFLDKIFTNNNNNSTPDKVIFIPRASQKPVSLDPLEADRTINLPVARMIYATPLEVSVDNTLTSPVLSSFDYYPEKKLAVWQMKDDINYSDGTQMTPEDIAFAIIRMIYFRKDFPVIKDILGVRDWLKEKSPLRSLPKGIRIFGKKIEIEFKRPISSPFFRFTLELFSIIPKRCVDLDTGKLSVKKIPTSGYYSILKETEKTIQFSLRRDPMSVHSVKVPTEIIFQYLPYNFNINDIKSFEQETVFYTTEFDLNKNNLVTQDLINLGFLVYPAPATNFIALLISPKLKPFDKKECRRVFAETVREVIVRKMKEDGITSEPTLFPPIVSGYLSSAQLKDYIKKTDKTDRDSNKTNNNIFDCLVYLRSHQIHWAQPPIERRKLIDLTVIEPSKRLNARLASPIEVKSVDDIYPLFANSKISFYLFGTGFWPLDSSGDIQMLFTPHLHSDLEIVWRDEKLQNLLKDLGILYEGEGIKNKMEEINRYIYQEAIFNPILQYRRLYATRSEKALKLLPLAVQEPYPWQTFGYR